MTRSAPDARQWDEARRQNRSHGVARRMFTVVGPHSIAGKVKGETVELEVTSDQADALILAGHVVEQSATSVAAPSMTLEQYRAESGPVDDILTVVDSPVEYTEPLPKVKSGKPFVPYSEDA